MLSMSALMEQPTHHSRIDLHVATHIQSAPTYTRSKQESNGSSPTQQSDSSPTHPFKCPCEHARQRAEERSHIYTSNQPQKPQKPTDTNNEDSNIEEICITLLKNFSNATCTHSKEATIYKAQNLNCAMFWVLFHLHL